MQPGLHFILKPAPSQAARARLRGQWAGLLGLPRMLAKRRAVQAGRTVSDDYILGLLTDA